MAAVARTFIRNKLTGKAQFPTGGEVQSSAAFKFVVPGTPETVPGVGTKSVHAIKGKVKCVPPSGE
jgi:hypothetical protein